MQRRSYRLSRRLAISLLSSSILVSGLPGIPAQAITQSQVDEACADSSEAYAAYRRARSEFETAAVALEEANHELDQAEGEEARIRSIYQARADEQEELQAQVAVQAAELYMQAVSGNTMTFSLSTPAEAMTALEFLSRNNQAGLDATRDLAANAAELDRLAVGLEQAVAELSVVRDDRAEQTANQEDAMSAALDAYGRLDDRCRELQAEYEAEQARMRAEAEARQKREAEARSRAASERASRPAEPEVVATPSDPPVRSGITCPFAAGRTQFIDSWGFPRSGGRTHKGTDMFAPFDEPVYAVAAGVIDTGNGGMGGKTVWLSADDGSAYYYAHLNGFAVSDGQRVQQGELIAYNGNSGNATGTSPHVHFQVHPSGRRGAPVNPYGTVAAVCF